MNAAGTYKPINRPLNAPTSHPIVFLLLILKYEGVIFAVPSENGVFASGIGVVRRELYPM